MRKIYSVGVDALLAWLMWLAAISFRITLTDFNAPDFFDYAKFGIIIGVLTAFFFDRYRLYDSLHFRSRTDEFFTVLRANGAAVLVFILLSYFFAEDRVSRGTIIIYAAISSVGFLALRFSIRSYLRRARSERKISREVVLVGDGDPLREYISIVNGHPHLGISVIGWIDAPQWAKELSIPLHRTRAESSRSGERPVAYIVSYASTSSAKVDEFLREAYNDVARIFVLPDLRSYALLGLRLDDFSGLPILALNQPRYATAELVTKRILDFLGSLLGLLILSPFFLVIAVLVKLSSNGPIFFGQERMGLDGKTFKMWKFRTMAADAPSTGWTVENDPRRTKIGTFLRSTSIDELPQLWNVLVGDMSLVGPRPEQPHYVETFRQEIPAYMLRHKMRAGMTGWAQINGWRGNTSLHKRIEYDLHYIKNWSIILDIKILFMTIWKGFINRNAY